MQPKQMFAAGPQAKKVVQAKETLKSVHAIRRVARGSREEVDDVDKVRLALRKLRASRSVARRAASRKASPVMAIRTVANLVR